MQPRTMTDEQMEEMGRTFAQMHKDAIHMWEIAIRTMPIHARRRREICKAGKSIEFLYLGLKGEAMDRWDDEKVANVFTSNTSCAFN
jgi:hypothetical protein